jgi:hypothetical protein
MHQRSANGNMGEPVIAASQSRAVMSRRKLPRTLLWRVLVVPFNLELALLIFPRASYIGAEPTGRVFHTRQK